VDIESGIEIERPEQSLGHAGLAAAERRGRGLGLKTRKAAKVPGATAALGWDESDDSRALPVGPPHQSRSLHFALLVVGARVRDRCAGSRVHLSAGYECVEKRLRKARLGREQPPIGSTSN